MAPRTHHSGTALSGHHVGHLGVVRVTATLLHDVLPIDKPLQTVTIRNPVLTLAGHLDQGLGDEPWSFLDRHPRDWGVLPIPDGPLTGEIDGGM